MRSPSGIVMRIDAFTTVDTTFGQYWKRDAKYDKSIIATFYRIKVETDCVANVANCFGRLTNIQMNGITILSGENLHLTFVPAEAPDTEAKLIHHGISEYLDLIAISCDNKVIIATPNFELPTNLSEKLLTEIGDYLFTVVVASKDSISQTVKIILHWTGDWRTVHLSQIKTD